MRGTVFKIEEFTVHDGPGTRVTVFLKGCSLRCLWCHNPEGLSPEPELMVNETRCIHCGRCFGGCGHEDCQKYGRCLHICPLGLVSECGRVWEAADLAEKLKGYAPFLRDGGVTFSGGEPLLQADFVTEVCGYLPHMHKAVQTAGYAPPEVFRALAAKMDYVMFDLKLADSGEHRRYTGVENGSILANFAWLQSSGIPYVVRVPLIPGMTDTEGNLAAIAGLTEGCEVEFLAYNPYAGAKYPMLGKAFLLGGEAAEDAGFKDEQNVVDYCKEIRRELWEERNGCHD